MFAVCSQCIRKHGDVQLRAVGYRHCPECRATWESSQLEANRAVQALDMAARAFRTARPDLLQQAKAAEASAHTRKRRRAVAQKQETAQLDNTRHAAQSPKTEEPGAVDHNTPPAGSESDASPSWGPSEDERDTEHRPAKRAASAKPPKVPAAKQSAALPTSAAFKGRTAAKPGNHSRAPQDDKVPDGCQRCPVCQRLFNVANLPGHVESCLSSAGAESVAPATDDNQAGPSTSRAGPSTSAEQASAAKGVLDLTASPGD